MCFLRSVTNCHNLGGLKQHLVITSQFLGFRILKHSSPGSSAQGITGRRQGVSWPEVSSGSWTGEGFQGHAGGWQDSFSCSYGNESSSSSVAVGQGLSPGPTGARCCLPRGPLHSVVSQGLRESRSQSSSKTEPCYNVMQSPGRHPPPLPYSIH